MKIMQVKPGEIKNYPRNTRDHPDVQVDVIAENIEKWGYTDPIFIDKDNYVIKGHGRYMSLLRLGAEEFTVFQTENREKDMDDASRIADNIVSELGSYNALYIPAVKSIGDDRLIEHLGDSMKEQKTDGMKFDIDDIESKFSDDMESENDFRKFQFSMMTDEYEIFMQNLEIKMIETGESNYSDCILNLLRYEREKDNTK